MLDAKDIELLRGMLAEQDKKFSERFDAQDKKFSEKFDAQDRKFSEMLAKQKQDILEESAANMRVMVESYFQPQFNLLAESIKSIEEKMIPRNEIEELHNEIDFLKMVVRSLSQDVAELKKAQ